LSEVTSLRIDADCSWQPFAKAVQTLLGASIIVNKRNELQPLQLFSNLGHGEAVRLAREVPELWKNTERLHTSLQFVNLAFFGTIATEILSRFLTI
jgi:hypothetical protein